MFLVGTHKDKLRKLFVKKHMKKKLAVAQKLISDFLSGMLVAKNTHIIEQIQRPSGDDDAWFFAVDSKSRSTNILTRKTWCTDPAIDELRNALQTCVKNDPREVPGLCAECHVSSARIVHLPFAP